MRARKFVIAILILIIILLTFFIVSPYWHKQSTHQLNPNLEWLGIIDLNDNNEPDLKNVLNGNPVVLVIDHANEIYHKLTEKIPQTKQLQLNEILNLNNLHLLDANSDSIIDNSDTVFQHLYVIKFSNNGDDFDIQPLSAVGIREIYVQRRTPTGNHIVILSDGSQRTLYNSSKFEP